MKFIPSICASACDSALVKVGGRPKQLLQLFALLTTTNNSLLHKERPCNSLRDSSFRIRQLHVASGGGGCDPRNNEDEAWLKKRGQEKHRLNRMAIKDKRIASLETLRRRGRGGEFDEDGDDNGNGDGGSSLYLSENEEKELAGLMKAGSVYEEQYTTSEFTKEHIAFKAKHNQVFANLVQYVQAAQPETPINVFYLDGPDAGTSLALLKDVDDTNSDGDTDDAGIEHMNIHPKQCYIANRHDSTCEKLKKQIPGINVAHASAADALSSHNALDKSDDLENDGAGTVSMDTKVERSMGEFGDVSFSALYLDGCGGYIPLITDMINAALDHYTDMSTTNTSTIQPPHSIAIGFSILGGNRDVVDKEQDVIRELVSMIKRRNLRMRVDHVLDDPERYGISPDLNVRKVDGGTMTTWVMLEKDDEK